MKKKCFDGEAVAGLDARSRKFYDMLMNAREQIMGQMNEHAAEALDCSNADKRGVTTHMADMGSDSARHEMDLRLMSEEGNSITLIDDALDRIFDGTFGKCQECGGDIPEGRLNIRPFAIYCVKCKSKLESSRR